MALAHSLYYVDSVLWLGWTAEEKVFVLSIGEVDDVQIQQSASPMETANPNVSLDTKVPELAFTIITHATLGFLGHHCEEFVMVQLWIEG